MVSEPTMKLISEFQKYLVSKDDAEIKKYSLEDLQHADASIGNLDSNAGFRIALRNRIKHLETLQERSYQGGGEKLRYLAGFIGGVVATVLAQWIIKKLGIG